MSGVGRVSRVRRVGKALRSAFLLLTLILSGVSVHAQADHGAQYSQPEIAAGYGLYVSQCAQCHGANGDNVSGIDLRKGLFRRSSSDEDLARTITNGSPAGMPPFKLQPAELAGVIAFIRAGFDQTSSVTVGNAARGLALFDGKGECRSCHRVQGRGPRAAPDLTGVGLARTPAALQRSLLDPSSAMLPINRPVRIVMKDGQTIRGRRLNEDTYNVQIIDAQERLRSLPKADIRTLDIETASPMPSYASRLTADEIADVLGFLITLREP